MDIQVTGGDDSPFDMAEFAGNLVIKSHVEPDPEGIWHHVWRAENHPDFYKVEPKGLRATMIALILIALMVKVSPSMLKQFQQMYSEVTFKKRVVSKRLQPLESHVGRSRETEVFGARAFS